MCICDNKNIGEEVVLKSSENPFCFNETEFLNLGLYRRDKWTAELHAWTTVGGNQPVLTVEKKINYCPMCGRRLTLEDAGKEKR